MIWTSLFFWWLYLIVTSSRASRRADKSEDGDERWYLRCRAVDFSYYALYVCMFMWPAIYVDTLLFHVLFGGN